MRSCLLELFPFWFFEFLEASTLDEPNKKEQKYAFGESYRVPNYQNRPKTRTVELV